MELKNSFRQLSHQFFSEYNSKKDNSIRCIPYVKLSRGKEDGGRGCEEFVDQFNSCNKTPLSFEEKKSRNASLPSSERCLICYTVISDDKKEKRVIDSQTLQTFLQIVVKDKSLKIFYGNGENNQSIEQLISTFNTAKKLESQIVELNAKFRNAVKLSRSIAVSQKCESSVRSVDKNVDKIRSLIIGSGAVVGATRSLRTGENVPKPYDSCFKISLLAPVEIPKAPTKKTGDESSEQPSAIDVPKSENLGSSTIETEEARLRPRKPITYSSEDFEENINLSNDNDDDVEMNEHDPEFIPSENEDDIEMDTESKKHEILEPNNISNVGGMIFNIDSNSISTTPECGTIICSTQLAKDSPESKICPPLDLETQQNSTVQMSAAEGAAASSKTSRRKIGISNPFSIFHTKPKSLGTSDGAKWFQKYRLMYPNKTRLEIIAECKRQRLAAEAKSHDGNGRSNVKRTIKKRKPRDKGNASEPVQQCAIDRSVNDIAEPDVKVEAETPLEDGDKNKEVKNEGESLKQAQTKRKRKLKGRSKIKGFANPRSFVHYPKEMLSWTSEAVRFREMKAKHPDKSNKEIKAFLSEKVKMEQNISDEGLPARGAMGRSGVRVFSKHNLQQLKEKGSIMFRNVEIRKLEDGTFVCGLCHDVERAQKCKHAESVVSHINQHHTDLTNAYECKHCGKKFYLHNIMLLHIREKHDKIRYQCHLCGQTFSNTSARHFHIKGVHEGIKPHTCEYCGKGFVVKKDLTIHVRRHTGERPFICHLCAATFVEKQSMKKHIRTKHPEATEEVGSLKLETDSVAGTSNPAIS